MKRSFGKPAHAHLRSAKLRNLRAENRPKIAVSPLEWLRRMKIGSDQVGAFSTMRQADHSQRRHIFSPIPCWWLELKARNDVLVIQADEWNTQFFGGDGKKRFEICN